MDALPQPFDLQGRTAFVPGGYGAIGHAICRALAAAGARVAVAGRNARRPKRWQRSSASAGHDALGFAMDAHAGGRHPPLRR